MSNHNTISHNTTGHNTTSHEACGGGTNGLSVGVTTNINTHNANISGEIHFGSEHVSINTSLVHTQPYQFTTGTNQFNVGGSVCF